MGLIGRLSIAQSGARVKGESAFEGDHVGQPRRVAGSGGLRRATESTGANDANSCGDQDIENASDLDGELHGENP
jgi:hypothetical protein